MQKSGFLAGVQYQRAIAVIRSPELSLGIAMAQAVAAGGMRFIEITWNSEQPGELIHQLRLKLPDCFIGAGTLLSLTDLSEALQSGAQFLFSPHTNLKLIQAALEAEVPIIPGALSPTEIITAWEAGATCVKVFPVQAMGGVNYIRSLAPVLGQIDLIPTGGITLSNAQAFIQAGAMAVGLSSDLFPKDLIVARDWDAIAQLAATLLEKLKL